VLAALREDRQFWWRVLEGLAVVAAAVAGFLGGRHSRRRRDPDPDLRELFDRAPAACHSLNPDGVFVEINQTELDWLGYARGEIVGVRRFGDFLTDAGRQTFAANFPRLLAEGRVDDLEFDLIRRDGSAMPVLLSATAVLDASGRFVASRSMMFDLRGRRAGEMARQRAFLRQVIDLDPSFIFAKDREGRFVLANQAAAEAYGTTTDAIIGRTDRDFNPDVSEVDHFRRDDLDVIDGGREKLIPEERITDASGRTRWLQTIKRPLPAPDGSGTLVLGIAVDITERKRAENEVRALNADLEARVEMRTRELEEANRELEAFSYSVSHDLRAPLRHIHGYVEMLTRATEGQLSDKARRYLSTIASASREMGVLIDDLLSFSRMGRAELREERVDLNALIEECRAGLDTAGRAIDWEIAPLPEACGDRAMLKQVVANLLDNAVKYTRPRERAVVAVSEAPSADPAWVTVAVRDNGVGFDPAFAGKLFGVFQRLHRADEFEGTGIGLANIRRIVTRHGGRVWAESEPGRGASFYFTLRRAGPEGSG